MRQLLRMRTFQGFWAQYGRHLVSSLLCLPSKKGPNTMISYCVILAFVLGAEARLEFPERYAGRMILSRNSVVEKMTNIFSWKKNIQNK